MIKKTIAMISVVMIGGLLASVAYAAPITLNDAQLDGVAAGGVEKVAGFVCPVIPGKGLANNPKFFTLPVGGNPSGYYSFEGPNVSVPVHATNTDGAGSPAGPFAAPGDTGYTAIWKK